MNGKEIKIKGVLKIENEEEEQKAKTMIEEALFYLPLDVFVEFE